MKPLDKKTAQALLTTLVFAVALLFLYAAWRVIIAFLFAIFFAYLLEAPVSWLQTWLKGSRGAAIAVVYAIFTAGLVAVFVLAGPPVMGEVQQLIKQYPHLTEKIHQVRAQHEKTLGPILDYVDVHRAEIISRSQDIIFRAIRTLENMWWLLLVPMLAIFFLRDGRKFGQIIINSVKDKRNRQIVAMTVDEMNSMLGHYIRSQLLLASLAIVVITAVISAMRVPYAFALGPAAGALEFIPMIGPILGGALVLLVAFLASYTHFWWLLLFFLVWRGIQDYVSSPRIMGSTLELHPLAVLFGVLAGGEVAGVIGVFLSIPVLATVRILWHTWKLYRDSTTGHLELMQKETPS